MKRWAHNSLGFGEGLLGLWTLQEREMSTQLSNARWFKFDLALGYPNLKARSGAVEFNGSPYRTASAAWSLSFTSTLYFTN